MQYWLFKTEPDECSIEDIKAKESITWDGVRNYQARNFMRDQVKRNDLVLVYHSSTKNIGVAGIAKVSEQAFADPTQFDPKSPYFDSKSTADNPRWISVKLVHQETFKDIILLKDMKLNSKLKEMMLFKNPRLSIQPVTEKEFDIIYQMSGHS
jgi:predicted RNA-binding protein with PUA-like domain